MIENLFRPQSTRIIEALLKGSKSLTELSTILELSKPTLQQKHLNRLEEIGVVVTPGVGYGEHGEGYVRLSLTIPDAGLVKGLSRLSGWRGTKKLAY